MEVAQKLAERPLYYELRGESDKATEAVTRLREYTTETFGKRRMCIFRRGVLQLPDGARLSVREYMCASPHVLKYSAEVEYDHTTDADMPTFECLQQAAENGESFYCIRATGPDESRWDLAHIFLPDTIPFTWQLFGGLVSNALGRARNSENGSDMRWPRLVNVVARRLTKEIDEF